MNARAEFAANLRAERKRVNISAEELAATSDVSVASINAYEQERTSPNLENICKLALALNVSPNQLCGWSNWPALT